jgi:SPOR domain
MSMADDYTSRSPRSNDPYRRAAGPAEADGPPRSSDPLAELARLIGQTDPFAEFARNTARAAEQPAQAPPPSAPDWRRGPAPSYATPRAQPAAAGPASSGYQRRDPHQMVSGSEEVPQPEYDDSHGYDHDALQPGAYGSQAAPGYAAAPPDQRDPDAFIDDGMAMGPHDDEIYDDAAPSPRWRKSGLTAITIVVCAVLGSAGAYAYRSYTTGARATQAPPVIVAEKTPTKVVPANDPQSGKSITDRVRDPGPNERIVSREEQPVELRNMITTAPPRVVLQNAPPPSQAQASVPGGPASVGSLPPTASSSQPISEPKRVRTVTIRPDNADLSGRPVGSLGTPSGLAQVPSTRGAPPPTARPTTPNARDSNPVSLDPQAAPRERAPAVAAPPTRLASVPSNGSTGGYVVQLSSQKSDSEAQASIRTLQAKYPHLLNSRPPSVQRADLGAKGVYYRAVVGPFTSSSEAESFCAGLKAAGGQCITQRN